jgi:hypothetical protein
MISSLAGLCPAPWEYAIANISKGKETHKQQHRMQGTQKLIYPSIINTKDKTVSSGASS